MGPGVVELFLFDGVGGGGAKRTILMDLQYPYQRVLLSELSLRLISSATPRGREGGGVSPPVGGCANTKHTSSDDND